MKVDLNEKQLNIVLDALKTYDCKMNQVDEVLELQHILENNK